MVKFGLPSRQRKGFDSSAPALLVENLETGYSGNRRALSDINLEVAPGECVAVIGPNGAGKSTLFKAIVGLLSFSRGHITIHGLDCHSSHSYVGYVPQRSEIDWSFPVSVYDVVMMGRNRHIGWFRMPGKRDRAIVYDLLEHLSLAGFANRQISELSGGQRRRVFVARALAQGSRVLLMDEPFSGVDQHAETEIFEALDMLRRHDITIMLSTHHLHDADLHFDKVLILNGGMLAYGPPADVLTPQNLREAFGATLPVLQPQDDLLLFGDNRDQEA